ncbi:hypothetical protein [Maribacter halichondriae]|uniref:hypothetical protein n=1 Tax=Maribacter halichondriae TaxID=2980554 RepID=UPI0023581084|nr:hypothetical protein [Maribacter sp. Hal144]
MPKNDSIFNTVEEIGIVRVNGKKAVFIKTYGSEGLLDFLALHQKSTSNYQGNSVRELGNTNFLNANFDPLVQNFVANYSTVLENVFVFTENKETVQTIISNYKNGNTFGKNPVYGFASKNVGSSASILWISNANHVEQLVKDNFIEDIHVNLKDSKFNGYAFAGQMVANGDFFHINLSAQKMSTEKALKIIKPLFTVSLDAEPATNPQFITNHNTKKKEIIVQDVTNNLYLISNNGKILWKKQLKGPVQGKIHQVDLYKNGRLQLAFTTNSEFLILDRNGKEVKPFTISYEGGNLNPLAVFDYEGKKDYRFVITQGEKVFMYDRNAKIVKGFKYTRADSPILDAPKHLVVGNKDYLAFKLENGSLRLLNRVGDVRTKVSEKIDFSENEVYIHKNKFTLTDKEGTLYQIDSQGKITKTAFNLNQDHGFDATSNTLAHMNDNTLSIKGKTIELDLGVYTNPKIFYLNDKIYVSVTDIQNQQVYLFDSQAKPIPNFPIFGTSIIDLDDVDNDQKLELTVKNQDNSIVLYTIN